MKQDLYASTYAVFLDDIFINIYINVIKLLDDWYVGSVPQKKV